MTFGTTTAPTPLPVLVKLANDEPLFAALKAYTQALAAVTNATDDTALTQATHSLTSTASGLAGAVTKLAPSAAAGSALVNPAGGLFGQGITLYLDSRRYAALQAAVVAVDPSIKVLGQTVEADLYAIRAHQIERLQQNLHEAIKPFRADPVSLSEGDYQAHLIALQAKVDVINQARAVDPKAIAAAMANAHHRLALALQDSTGAGLPDLTEVTNFAMAAGQLKTAIDAAASASTSPKK